VEKSEKQRFYGQNKMKNHELTKKWKKVKNKDSMGKTNFFFNTLPFSP
jgi:hypothetical protein